MDVAWIANDPCTREVALTETRSHPAAFVSRLKQLVGIGEGYAEVRHVKGDFPTLTLSLRGDHAVLHLLESSDDSRLLRGDGVVPSTGTVEVPILGDDCAFSGEFVCSLDRASAVVEAFIAGAPTDRLGEWLSL